MASREIRIRATDVGFGGTKYTRQVTGDDIICDAFASLAATDASASADTNPIDTVRTTIDGVSYACGKEAHLALGGLGFGRVQRPDYPTTPQYQALVNASLFYMGESELDVLVLGLPVSTYNHQKQLLTEKMKGVRSYSRLDRNDGTPRQLRCDVKNVLVLRQPMGGLYDIYSNPELSNLLTNGKTLILDPGFFTLDWIVAENKKPIESRCGASNDGGVSAVYKAVSAQIKKNTGQHVDISRIETAYTTTGEIRVSGELISLSQFDNIVNNTLNEALNQMESEIGGYSDIENIAVVGGPAMLYKKALQPRVKNFDIIVPPEPMFSNVRGFQVAGEVWGATHL